MAPWIIKLEKKKKDAGTSSSQFLSQFQTEFSEAACNCFNNRRVCSKVSPGDAVSPSNFGREWPGATAYSAAIRAYGWHDPWSWQGGDSRVRRVASPVKKTSNCFRATSWGTSNTEHPPALPASVGTKTITLPRRKKLCAEGEGYAQTLYIYIYIHIERT